MKLVLLPGLDGTGRLFAPFIKEIKPEMEVVQIDGPHLLLQQNPHECLRAIDQFVNRVARFN
ncbi:MAG: hypothetical protein ACRD8U_05670 [Pyrinomonadaceae bacterium]